MSAGVSGGVRRAEAGTLTIMAGASDATFGQVRPLPGQGLASAAGVAGAQPR